MMKIHGDANFTFIPLGEWLSGSLHAWEKKICLILSVGREVVIFIRLLYVINDWNISLVVATDNIGCGYY